MTTDLLSELEAMHSPYFQISRQKCLKSYAYFEQVHCTNIKLTIRMNSYSKIGFHLSGFLDGFQYWSTRSNKNI